MISTRVIKKPTCTALAYDVAREMPIASLEAPPHFTSDVNRKAAGFIASCRGFNLKCDVGLE